MVLLFSGLGLREVFFGGGASAGADEEAVFGGEEAKDEWLANLLPTAGLSELFLEGIAGRSGSSRSDWWRSGSGGGRGRGRDKSG
jgi:hypothetical protein